MIFNHRNPLCVRRSRIGPSRKSRVERKLVGEFTENARIVLAQRDPSCALQLDKKEVYIFSYHRPDLGSIICEIVSRAYCDMEPAESVSIVG